MSIFKNSNYEMLMKAVPNFTKRGGGMTILNRFKYTSQMCDCNYCLYYKKKTGCMKKKCPFIPERVEAGIALFREMMLETMKGINNRSFKARLYRYINRDDRQSFIYMDKRHEEIFSEVSKRINQDNFKLLAAVYLLTADCTLWMSSEKFLERNNIRLNLIKPKCLTENGYILFSTAKDLYLKATHLTIKDMTDSEIISPQMFAIICNALAIERFGLDFFKCMK